MSRVLVLDFEVERLRILCDGLQAGGHEVVVPSASSADLLRLVRELAPDVVIIDTDSPQRDTLEDILAVTREDPKPILMFSSDPDGEKIRAAVQAGVSAYVVNGLAAQRIQPILDAAIARFNETQALRAELTAARARLEDRKIIDRAKGILMETRGMSEEQAYETLRSLAMDSSQRIVEVARQVINMRSLLDPSK